LALQHLTTRQPDLDMIEVAITAFKRVLLAEGLIKPEEAEIPTALKPQDTTFSRELAKERAEKARKAAGAEKKAGVSQPSAQEAPARETAEPTGD
ncbi:MAG: DUF1385 domain-containing protein, partial [Phototrophicaceae bacterium]